MKSFETICIHGRFQPFHKGHQDYFERAFHYADKVIIGLTRVLPGEIGTNLAPHRISIASNPLTYLERMTSITFSLLGAGYSRSNFAFVPFPLETPQLLSSFVPTHIPCATTDFLEWNKFKIEVLRNAGYQVIVLSDCIKQPFSGSDIRRAIASGTDEWRSMVVPENADYLDSLELKQRLNSKDL
jgi:nicotinamide mononucleotide adenylyltransferase